jgi:hypothetical protein
VWSNCGIFSVNPAGTYGYHQIESLRIFIMSQELGCSSVKDNKRVTVTAVLHGRLTIK